ncbi:MAG: hypothetical protein N3A54_01165 [Patescibacteria group bacterium]|nr:hypothetical protein [Patescibacteria group bacterium]
MYRKSVFDTQAWQKTLELQILDWNSIGSKRSYVEIDYDEFFSYFSNLILVPRPRVIKFLFEPPYPETSENINNIFKNCIYMATFWFHDGKLVFLFKDFKDKKEKYRLVLSTPYLINCNHVFEQLDPFASDTDGMPRPSPYTGYRVFYCKICGYYYDEDSSG